MAFTCRRCHVNPDACISFAIGIRSYGACESCGVSAPCSDCRCATRAVETCSGCGRDADAVIAGVASCIRCRTLQSASRKVIAATSIHDIYTASDFTREPRS